LLKIEAGIREKQGTEGAEGASIETPKAPRGRGFPLPSRLGGLGERREPKHSRHISGPQKPSSRSNALSLRRCEIPRNS